MARRPSTKPKPKPKSKPKTRSKTVVKAKPKAQPSVTPTVSTKVPTKTKLLTPLLFVGVGVIFALAAWGTIVSVPTATGRGVSNSSPTKFNQDYAKLQAAASKFLQFESHNDVSVISSQDLNKRVSAIGLQATGGNYVQAETNIRALSDQINKWHKQLAAGPAPSQPAEVVADGTFIPILIYHYPPSDLDQQLTYLSDNHYTVVSLDAVVAAMEGGAALPAKPAVLTFDDGFANQMQAFDILKKHNMTATFFIINGGPGSNWCIGAGRQYGLPSQPASGCGDAYLTWDQVRQLDQSGLITIGGHTIDHPELATLSIDQQRHEIIDSKTEIEAEIGHPIYDFAYPYGNYDNDTINIVREAGYRVAVTTNATDYHPAGSEYTLGRIRSTYGLP